MLWVPLAMSIWVSLCPHLHACVCVYVYMRPRAFVCVCLHVCTSVHLHSSVYRKLIIWTRSDTNESLCLDVSFIQDVLYIDVGTCKLLVVSLPPDNQIQGGCLSQVAANTDEQGEWGLNVTAAFYLANPCGSSPSPYRGYR